VTRSLYEPSLWRATAKNGSGVKSLERRPLAMRWWQPDCTPGTDGCTGEEPVLQNFWAQPSAPLETFAFRLHADGSLEFRGHLNASGATSSTVAVTLPGANPGEAKFLPENDQYFVTVITTDDGTSFSTALVFIDSTTGEVTITWPVS
jgi:hypothetical protein